jgi:hypothetical protein
MILGWSSSKTVSGISEYRPRMILGGITGHNFGRGPSKDYSTKVWLQLAQWFLRRRFLCEFPIRSYVKLNLAVGAILIEGPIRRTHIWKRTIRKKGDEFKKKKSSQTTEPISTKLC